MELSDVELDAMGDKDCLVAASAADNSADAAYVSLVPAELNFPLVADHLLLLPSEARALLDLEAAIAEEEDALDAMWAKRRFWTESFFGDRYSNADDWRIVVPRIRQTGRERFSFNTARNTAAASASKERYRANVKKLEELRANIAAAVAARCVNSAAALSERQRVAALAARGVDSLLASRATLEQALAKQQAVLDGFVADPRHWYTTLFWTHYFCASDFRGRVKNVPRRILPSESGLHSDGAEPGGVVSFFNWQSRLFGSLELTFLGQRLERQRRAIKEQLKLVVAALEVHAVAGEKDKRV